jgi:uncharacterized cupredoxin-like copper-binding protein
MMSWGAAMLLSAAGTPQAAVNPEPHPAVAAQDIDWSHAKTITVQLTDFEFTPDHLGLQVGVPVRLMLVNNGSGKHDFSAPEFFAAVAYRAGSRWPNTGGITLKKKESVELDVVPSAPGSYPLRCTEFLHALFGMTGKIDVSPSPS